MATADLKSSDPYISRTQTFSVKNFPNFFTHVGNCTVHEILWYKMVKIVDYLQPKLTIHLSVIFWKVNCVSV